MHEARAAVQDAMLAAALLAVDPVGLGGVRIQAQAGPVRDAWLTWLQALLPASAPWRRLPQHTSEDRLIGGIDLPSTLALGRPVLQQGLLAAADGGVVLVAMAERLAPATAAVLTAVMDQHLLRIERDGLSATTATRFAVVALDEALPDDGPLSAGLADRLALWLDLNPLTVRDAQHLDESMSAAVQEARSLWPEVTVDDATVEALCAATLALGVDSPRSAWLAVQVARASAALFGRRVADADDAALAARLVLGPRATRLPPAEATEPAPQPEAPQEPPQSPPPQEGDHDKSDQEQTSEVADLEDRVVDAAAAAIPAGLLAQLMNGDRRRDRAASAGKAGALSASRLRGRPLGAIKGSPHAGSRLHLIATLRAAAPWQAIRRQLAPSGVERIRVLPEDFHIRRFAQRRNTTTVFAVDASGSSALYRLAEAKGAVELLLAQCYVRRDQVAVIAFRGSDAEVLLPPTRSLVRAKRALAGLPGGGGTPLALGIDAAAAVASQVRRSGATPVVVLLTDGRANVDRSGQGGRQQAQQDARVSAGRLRALGAQTLLVDTSVRPEPAAAALAVAMGARYLALPQADAAALSGAVARAIAADVRC